MILFTDVEDAPDSEEEGEDDIIEEITDQKTIEELRTELENSVNFADTPKGIT